MYQVGNRHVKMENKGLWEKIKGTSAKEEIQKLGWKIQGVDSAMGDKMHEGENKM